MVETANAQIPRCVTVSNRSIINTMDIDTDFLPHSSLGELPTMLAAEANEAERSGFSGVLRVDAQGQLLYESAHGLADRAHRVPNTCQTRFAAASGTKGFVAAVVMVLAERGQLSLSTTARSLLGGDLPLIDDHVTIEQLLGHRSGIGDYLDESERISINDYVMAEPVHAVDSPAAALVLLAHRPMTDQPGTRFAYNNSGFVLLALLAERATGASFYDLGRRTRLPTRPAAVNRSASNRCTPWRYGTGVPPQGRAAIQHPARAREGDW